MRQGLNLILMCVLTGCASFKTIQIDESNPITGLRKITTTVSTRTFWDSKSDLAKLKASTTDKAQSIGVGSVINESSSTNAIAMIEAIVTAAIKAARP